MLKTLLDSKGISLYKLEKAGNIPHATLNDLYNERTNVQKCTSSLVHDIAKALNMSMDKLYLILSYEDLSLLAFNDTFDLFKSNVCHELKALGFKEFLRKHLSDNLVAKYYYENRYPESLYLLAMIDYLCVEHGLPLTREYDEIRQYKLDKLYVSKSTFLLLKTKSRSLSDLRGDSIPTFMCHNIFEADIYNVQ